MLKETTVHSNGSKWAGESPDPIEVLEKKLMKHTLDPRFEDFGNFSYKHNSSDWFFGNFIDVSSSFRIETKDKKLSSKLKGLISANKKTLAYKMHSQERKDDIELNKRLDVKYLAGEISAADWNRLRVFI